MGFQEISTPEQFEAVFPVMKVLRPHLDFEAFEEIYLASKRHDQYTLVAEFEADEAVAVMGYRILYDFVRGKHLYIDDLVVLPKYRSKGLGAAMLKYAERMAKKLDCKSLRLCTGTENTNGIRFYEREGWTLRAHAFTKPAV